MWLVARGGSAFAGTVAAWLAGAAAGLVEAPRGAACELACSDRSIPEPYGCPDPFDGGCSTIPPPWFPANPGDIFCGTAWADSGVRDTDFYLLCVDDPDGDGFAQLCGTVASELPVVCFIVDGIAQHGCEPLQCSPIAIGTIGCGDGCQTIAVARHCVPAPGEYAVFVAPGLCNGSGIFDGFPCGTSNDYQLCISVTDACDEDCGACELGITCPGDFDEDGMIGITDLLLLLGNWGNPFGSNDLTHLLANWGLCPA